MSDAQKKNGMRIALAAGLLAALVAFVIAFGGMQ